MKKIDFHVHLTDGCKVEESAKNFTKMCERHGYDGVAIMAISHHYGRFINDINERCMAVKKLMKNSYVFACPVHDGSEYTEQAKRFMSEGFDGIKLLNGKPSEFRDLKCGIDDPILDRFFAYAEREGIPIMLHNNDPELHWDITKMTPRAIERGWHYDSTIPSHEYFDGVLDKMLLRYPALNIAIAHMGFHANELEHLTMLMESCPNLKVDITPALIIYSHLTNNLSEAQKFFNKYSHRLIYGTDAESNLTGAALDYNNKKVSIIRQFLEGEGEKEIDGQLTGSIKLTDAQLQDIYYNNAINFVKKG